MKALKVLFGAMLAAAPWTVAAQDSGSPATSPPALGANLGFAQDSDISLNPAPFDPLAPPTTAATAESAAPAVDPPIAVAETEEDVKAEATAEAEAEAIEPEATEDSSPAPAQVEAEPAADASPTAEAAAPAELAAPAVEAPAAVEPAAPSPKPSTAGPKHVVYPGDRPAWVDGGPVKEGSIERIAVSSGPHYSLGEARRQLDEAVSQTVVDYVNHHLGAANASRYLSYEIAPVKTYEERPEFSFGPMYQAHALIEFDDAFRQRVDRDWKEALTLSRLSKMGLGVAGVFVLLSVLLGYLRADTATRGYYTRRLRFGAAGAILAMAAAIYFAIRWIPWMI